MFAGVSELEIVNPVPVQEVEGWTDAVVTTLLGNPHDEHRPRRLDRWSRKWIAERSWGGRADGRWVATLATEPRLLSVPGPHESTTDVRADALTAVTVAATHRRRGVLTRMLGASLTAARERGDALSILVAAEWPIYGRFGYAPAVRTARYSYFPRSPAAKVSPSGQAATLRQVDREQAGRLGEPLFAAARRLRAGQVDRPHDWWATQHGLDGYVPPPSAGQPVYVVRDGPSGVDGLIAWHVTRDFDLTGDLGAIEVDELFASNDAAYRDLWAYLSGIDAVGEIMLPNRPVDEPVRWLLADGRALRETYAGDHVWVRLLDVPAALSSRCYATAGRLTIEVTGDPAGYANGRFELDGGPDGARCVPSTGTAQLRVSHRALAASYLGGHRLRELAITGEVDELDGGAIARADAMFAAPLAPWNATGF